MKLYTVESGLQSGFYNMSLDEAILETLRNQQQPCLVVRTYRWEKPTLSLGVNQQVRDIRFLLAYYGKTTSHSAPLETVIRRPTGGRAILHGEDISYAFITNDPTVLRQGLKSSYEIYANIIKRTLARLALSASFVEGANEKDYLRSPVCFETCTPSDLMGEDGKKLTGSAQLRRIGALLQHGSAFLQPYGIRVSQFTQALHETVEIEMRQPVKPFPNDLLGMIEPLRKELEAAYRKESTEILAKASVINESHLEPASV